MCCGRRTPVSRTPDFMLPKREFRIYPSNILPVSSVKTTKASVGTPSRQPAVNILQRKGGQGPEWKDQRHIYAFDLKTHQLDKDPLFAF